MGCCDGCCANGRERLDKGKPFKAVPFYIKRFARLGSFSGACASNAFCVNAACSHAAHRVWSRVAALALQLLRARMCTTRVGVGLF